VEEEPDPPPVGPTVEITFKHLSLLGVDVKEILDALFEGGEAARSWEFPESLQDLDGREVGIAGYMLPLDWSADGERVKHFMLVRDLADCCFGGMPRPDEWVDVTMGAGKFADFLYRRPVRVEGRFSLGANWTEGDLVPSTFQMLGRSVERYP